MAASKKRGRATKAPILVIFDMNGVLMKRSSDRQSADMRPHLDKLLATLWDLQDRVYVAVWSSMMAHNLHPWVKTGFGEFASQLAFVWDQSWCTQRNVPGMDKMLLRKDLEWLAQTEWWSYMPDHVLLIDDDPIKCTENPEGSAIHPSSFKGVRSKDKDSELLKMSAYLRALADSDGSVSEFVLAHPYDEFDREAAQAPKSLKRRRLADEDVTERFHTGSDGGTAGKSKTSSTSGRKSTSKLEGRGTSRQGGGDNFEEFDLVDNSFVGCNDQSDNADDDDDLVDRSFVSKKDDEAEDDLVDISGFVDDAAGEGSTVKRDAKLKLEFGDGVEAFWPDDETWLPATVVETLKGDSVRIQWDEDASESVVPGSFLRQPGS